jgi:hypothetical protein
MTTLTPLLRAPRFWLITGSADCWKCSQPTPVSAIVLDGYEEAVDDEEWEPSAERTVLSYITAIDAASLAAIQAVAPWLRYGRSETADTTYLANHCERCGVLQGDWFLTEAGAVFFPTDKSEVQDFRVARFDQRLEIDAQCAWSGWHEWILIN